MNEFRFFIPITVRYGDLDPQGHVNNARYLTYMEQVRVSYFRHLGLQDGNSFLNFGIIIANAHINFKAPILWGQDIRAGMCISRLGTKSMDSHYRIEASPSGQILADGSSVLVAFNYHVGSTIPIPEDWRKIITEFEHLS